MIGMLVAYDTSGQIIATLWKAVQTADDGTVGMVDFLAAEASGPLTEVWHVPGAAGSGTWPEWLGSGAHMFKVVRDPSHPHPIRELVHVGRPATADESSQPIPAIPASGHRRIRDDIEAAVQARLGQALADAAPTVDIRDITGLPDEPLQLLPDGTTRPPQSRLIPRLPWIGAEDSSATSPEVASGSDTLGPAGTASP